MELSIRHGKIRNDRKVDVRIDVFLGSVIIRVHHKADLCAVVIQFKHEPAVLVLAVR